MSKTTGHVQGHSGVEGQKKAWLKQGLLVSGGNFESLPSELKWAQEADYEIKKQLKQPAGSGQKCLCFRMWKKETVESGELQVGSLESGGLQQKSESSL